MQIKNFPFLGRVRVLSCTSLQLKTTSRRFLEMGRVIAFAWNPDRAFILPTRAVFCNDGLDVFFCLLFSSVFFSGNGPLPMLGFRSLLYLLLGKGDSGLSRQALPPSPGFCVFAPCFCFLGELLAGSSCCSVDHSYFCSFFMNFMKIPHYQVGELQVSSLRFDSCQYFICL